MMSRSLSPKRFSSTLKAFNTPLAPPPAASYSQAMKVNNLIYVSGQIPLTPDNKPVQGDIKIKVEQVISNIADFNSVYAKYFSEHKPARSCVAVKELPLGMDLEVEVVAVEKD